MSNFPLALGRGFAICWLAVVGLARAADFPALYNSEKGDPSPISPEEALQALKMPPGFTATMWAHEPEVQNPIGMAWDTHGRMWVAENYTYAERAVRFDLNLRDRVIILQDKDGDGVAETRKVFTDNVQMLTSVEVGRGGVWLMCPPQLLFIPDANGDDVPDGPPQVVLDGFTVPKDNYHNFANGLRWGPDGWLYGRCGGSAPGEIGRPGTKAEDRIPLRGTMWRYHPERMTVEVLSSGTTNPWGHDWDQYGELFFTNTVNGHLWHGLTGAHFVRPFSFDPNPNAYVALDMIADHWHFDTGKGWQASRDGAANDLGGGHAHCGAMIYQGDRWPEQYRNQLFTLNLHGRRANVELLERKGSGYVAHHGPDTFFFGDPWFRGIDMQQGPDGAAYVLDWSDTGECHDSNGVHRTSGRIYKINYGDKAPQPPEDFAKMSDEALLEALKSTDGFRVRMAEQALAEGPATAHAALLRTLRQSYQGTAEEGLRLRTLLTLYRQGGADRDWLQARLADPGEHIRAWSIRLLTDELPLDWLTSLSHDPQPASLSDGSLAASLLPLAQDPSGLVRSTLASALQRLPLATRVSLASALVQRKEDAADHDLPAMVWYGLLPVGDAQPAELLKVVAGCEWPILVGYISRRLAVASEKSPAVLETLLQNAQSKPASYQLSVLQGLSEGFRGWRKAQKPAAWEALTASLSTSADEPTKALLRDLGTLFGDGRALDEVKRVALDGKAEIPVRAAALKALIDSKQPELRQICEQLLDVKGLNATAARGLASFDDAKVGELLAKSLPKFAPADRTAVIEVMATRPPWAMALLEQVRAGGVQRGEITAFHARQMRNLGDTKLNEQLAATWGELHESAADKQAQMAALRPHLTPELMKTAHPEQGRQTFSQTCAVCHTLYGEGGKIGPDLTGSNRQNLDYLLENVVDPSAVVTADFRVTLLTMKDGRVLSGMVVTSNERTLTLRTLTENQTLERGEIAKTEVLPASMMPEGLLQAFTPEQVRDLFAYLMTTQQVALPGQ